MTQLTQNDPIVAALRAPAFPAWRDLLSVTKPRMNVLVVATTFVGFWLASYLHHNAINWTLLLHTVLGTALTASAASVLNQLAERKFDAQMERTRGRALAAGRMTVLHASLWAALLGVSGLAYLALAVNDLTAMLGAMTLASYVLLYTPMKRSTSLCTIVGAIPGALPPVMGCAAAANHLGVESAILFAILFVWQMPHFLAIAILYRDDYIRGGFKMLPCLEPSKELWLTRAQIAIYAAALIPVSLLPATLDGIGRTYLLGAFALGVGFLAMSLVCAVNPTRRNARGVFIASIVYLPILLILMTGLAN